MIWRWSIVIIVGLLAGLWEVAVLPFLPPEFAFHPLLPLAVLLLVSSARGRAFAALIAGASVLDAYGWAHLDVATLRLSMVLLILDAASHRFLTNRSVYASVALVLLGRLLEWLGSFMLSAVGSWLDPSRYPWHLPIEPWWILVWDAISVGMGFLLIASFTRRFVTLGQRETTF
ncbi:hypothetical protein IPH19_00945 [Candidatus Uhrbacteria bacterium]|nr:MAG: hypothetical protein IPH19_00945 [Candidatus Uhrbacteria bacterium]